MDYLTLAHDVEILHCGFFFFFFFFFLNWGLKCKGRSIPFPCPAKVDNSQVPCMRKIIVCYQLHETFVVISDSFPSHFTIPLLLHPLFRLCLVRRFDS